MVKCYYIITEVVSLCSLMSRILQGTNCWANTTKHSPKIKSDALKVAFLATEWNSVHHMKETRLAPPQGLSQLWMWIVLEAIVDTNTNTQWLLLTTPRIIDLSLKLASGQLSQSLEIRDHAIFALTLYLKMTQTLCWSVLSTTPSHISSFHYMRM
jgi:hypothetical protein